MSAKATSQTKAPTARAAKPVRRRSKETPTSEGTTLESSRKLGLGKPTPSQQTYLQRGLTQPGGKLPLFDLYGRRVDGRIVQNCLDKGWAEPWFANPLKPDWLVCRLTPLGWAVAEANKVDQETKTVPDESPIS